MLIKNLDLFRFVIFTLRKSANLTLLEKCVNFLPNLFTEWFYDLKLQNVIHRTELNYSFC
jgi:hypothetical protein